MSSPGEVVIPTPRSIAVDTRGAQIITEDSPATRDSRGIYLPHYIEPVSHIAVDIGGSLAKLVYFTRSPLPPNGLDKAQIARGQGTSSSSPPKDDSPFIDPAETAAHDDPTPLRPNPNGALTPRVLATGELPSNPFEHAQWASFSASAEAGPSGSSSSSSSNPFARSSAYSSAGSSATSSSKRRSTMPNLPGGLINFTRFETAQIDQCIDFINSLIKQSAVANRVSVDQMKRGVKMIATGGGAHKFYDRFVAELGVEVVQEEEMECLITGLSFITSIPNEVFWYGDELVYEISHLSYPSPNPTPAPHLPSPPPQATSSSSSLPVKGHSSGDPASVPRPRPPPLTDLPRPSPDPPKFSVTFAPSPSAEPQFPCLLVNIGSGVSIVKVDRDGSFERVSGTSLGGGTLWGLLSLLTDAESFDEMLSLSERGDNSQVDMLVGDIYGSDYSKIGLKSSTIASSFGKVFQKGPRSSDGSGEGGIRRKKAAWKQEDLAKSLLYAVSNNIGQIAHMNAEKYDLERIYFGGCFIRGHPATISTLSYAIRFWSKGTKRAMFLRHEGFLGSIGAWIKNVASDYAAQAAGGGGGEGAAQKHAASEDSSSGLEEPAR